MEKAYSFGVLVGRFQTLHTGHEMMINKTIELCGRTAVFIGSSQESGTSKNPFSYETRAGMLRAVFENAIEIYPLPDIGVGNNSLWGEYVLERILSECGQKPDLFVTGKETRRGSWFDFEAGNSISELYVPKTIEISASQMREFFVNDSFDEWKKYVNPLLWKQYPELRAEVLSAQSNTRTESM